jgi:tungstate transport system permease protein
MIFTGGEPMQSAVSKAMELILSRNGELMNILEVTAKMSLQSSIFALLLGLPIGIWLGACRFPGRNVLLVANRTLMGMPPVVCGLLFYMLFSGVGPFRHMKLLFTVELMVLAQVVLITPIVVGNMETYVSGVAPAVRETARGLGFGVFKTFGLLCNECVYPIISAYLLAFARSIAEVGAVSMVGGAISWKTNVMTTAIMQYTNRGNFSLGIALGMILLTASLVVNIVISLLQRRLSR